MYRQIIGYIPSNVIPAAVSVIMIFAYTRLLSPAAFGVYSFVFSAVLVVQSSLFFALPIAVMRFYPGAVLAGRRNGLLKEAYVVFLGMALAAVLIGLGAFSLFQVPTDYRNAAWLALPLLLFRSLVQLNQSVNRSANLMGRFNLIECLHAVLGLGLALVALFLWRRQAEALVLGLLSAAVICALIDSALLMSPFRANAERLDGRHLMRLVDYAWPLVAVAASAMVLQNSDRFLLGSISGVEALGIFAVAYNLVDRATSVICASISTATFPLAVQVLENQGREAARLQAGQNGIALLAIALPACLGLALTTDQVAACLIGPAFREGVKALLPIMCFTALARGLRAHFIDHAFHLSGRPVMMLWTYAPAAAINIALNLYVVPRYGMLGAAWTALLCQTGTMIGGWFLGTALFPVWLPVQQVVRCLLAVVPMAAALVLVPFPMTWLGLAAAVVTGAALYVAAAALLDVGEVRTRGRAAWQQRRVARPVAALTDV